VFGGLGQPHRPRVHLADFLAPRRPGDPVGFLRGLCTPWRHPLATVCAALPEGPVSNEAISAGIDEAVGGRWPEAALWVCAVRLGDGAPAVFGRPGAPAAGLGAAVAASCAIPGYYRPVSIGGQRYVDGGVRSVHNADLLRDHADDLDLVVVSAPMAYAGRRPPMVADLALRQAVRVQLDWEVAALRRRGVEVVVVAPDRRMLTAMGVDAMDARRRGGVSRQARRMTLTQLASGDVATRVALAARTRRHRRPAA
jgi:NTE family protein